MRTLERVGRHLSTVVFQNITALMSLGLIRILFSPMGWFPNPHLYQTVNPALYYLVPTLFAYTGGKLIGGQRGGVTAAFVTIATAVGELKGFSLILPALIIGPLIGFCIKKADMLLEGRIPVGFELLFYNAAAGIVGCLFSFLFLQYFDTLFIRMMNVLISGIQYLVESNLLPLLAIIIEPGKVLFFNNAINHGILEPLGILHAKESGSSIFFLMETNPGPGLGLLLAYYFIRRRQNKKIGNIKSSTIIHALGGIHEVYFPYALMNPFVIIALVLGGLTGNLIFVLLHAGLVAAPSPGSIILMFIMAPMSMQLPVLTGFAASAIVTFSSALLILSRKRRYENRNENDKDNDVIIVQNSKIGGIRSIIFACDAGMGSSAMAAAMLRKRTADREQEFTIENASIEEIPLDTELVVVNKHMLARAQLVVPDAEFWPVSSFVDEDLYDQLVIRLSGKEKS